MMLTSADKSPAAGAAFGKPLAGIIGNEGGFVLAFAMFMLAVCMILGLASMNTSLDETAISANEVIMKKTFVNAGSGLPLSVIPLIATQGNGDPDNWYAASKDNPVYLDDRDPTKTAASGAIQILDGRFLEEYRDAELDDGYSGTGWNTAKKYYYAPSAKKAAYKPIDDPFQEAPYIYSSTLIDNVPDIRIRSGGLSIDIDVDRVREKACGSIEFGAGTDESCYIYFYVMNCKSTLYGKDLDDSGSPVAMNQLGYKFRNASGGSM